MQSGEGFNVGDLVVVAPQPPVTAAGTPSCSTPLTLDKVAAGTAAAPGVTVTTGGGSAGSLLYDLGQSLTVIGYAVRNGSLTSCNYTDVTKDCSAASTSGNWIEVAGNIPLVRALYGRDANAGTMSGVVDTWDQTQPTTTCSWARTSAISMVVVSRNGQASTTPVTTAAPTWSEAAWTGATMGSTTIDLSATDASLPTGSTWKNYRYKTYSTLVPLQNITWMGQVPGC
jgi:type IV pilus assembly protein PilW